MTVNDIRKKFLDFFAAKGHTLVESDTLVPKDDPTVLFTTAGMQQFKRQFLGHIEDYTRAATAQKCMRTDDLDEVGVTDFHHTFFEMLGNFSFGDYFKKEAINWAWEFLTKELQIPEERLWVSVYVEDPEAENIWLTEIGIPREKIFKLGGKSNFWPSNAKENGPNGPCGPCSEIFYDYDPTRGTVPKDPDDEPGRFSEVWNLVFTQFNRQDGGVLEPLPGKNIDTGMGLERLAAVLQGKKSNFETDIFQPILAAIDQHVRIDSPNERRNERYVLADHLRAVTIGIGDGVVPSNKDRGSVIRRLITEMTDIAVRHSGRLEPVINKLIPAAVAAMSPGYPDLKDKQQMICDNVLSVEKAFLKVRTERMPEFLETVKANKSDGDALGRHIFTYKDRYGLTLATMEGILKSENVSAGIQQTAMNVYEQLMSEQREQSRAASKMTGDVFADGSLQADLPKTDFKGYEQTVGVGRILSIMIDGNSAESAPAGTELQIILDKTPFYAESGGQVGDSGRLSHEGNEIRITDTQKLDDIWIHTGKVTQGSFSVGDVVTAEVDTERRLAIMRNHTATHLMQSALRRVLGEHIKQQGSLVDPDRLRFDFSHPKAITGEELDKIETHVNTFIRACDPVIVENLDIETARQSGALAFFAEKYGKTVRVVSIGDYSKEFCGGTHLDFTGQIGLFKISSESAIAQGIRRIEAATGVMALEQLNQLQDQMRQLAKGFKVPVDQVTAKVEAQSRKLKDIEKEFERVRFDALKSELEAQLSTVSTKDNGAPVFQKIFEDADMGLLRKLCDHLKQKLPGSLIILGARNEDGANVLICSPDDAVAKGWKANELIQIVADKIEGRGGGRPQLAQAGGKNAANLDDAIASLNEYLTKGNT
ncbi:MAG: alanine--tRNA ligase [Candidatus Omnitrophica bacterium]|nr:alanine--tRNA ligase [Candidatus Omnitrophota bacterium]MCB9721790.1 alanine--tRNA ligase [Candidatus Omnitrophota bacterium]